MVNSRRRGSRKPHFSDYLTVNGGPSSDVGPRRDQNSAANYEALWDHEGESVWISNMETAVRRPNPQARMSVKKGEFIQSKIRLKFYVNF